MVKSTDLGTVSILCFPSPFTAKWDTEQAHACNKHGILSCDGMYTEAQKITCMCMMVLCIQTWCSDVLIWPYITINVWQIQKTRIWLSITWNPFYLTKRKKKWMTYYSCVWGWCSCIITKSNNLHQLETCYTGLQNISIYCCTCQL